MLHVIGIYAVVNGYYLWHKITPQSHNMNKKVYDDNLNALNDFEWHFFTVACQFYSRLIICKLKKEEGGRYEKNFLSFSLCLPGKVFIVQGPVSDLKTLGADFQM